MLSQEAIDRIAGPIVRGPFGRLVGTEVARVEPDRLVIRLPVRTEVTNGADIVHGGATAMLVDTAATAAAWASDRVGPETRGTTVGFAINFLAPAGTVNCWPMPRWCSVAAASPSSTSWCAIAPAPPWPRPR